MDKTEQELKLWKHNLRAAKHLMNAESEKLGDTVSEQVAKIIYNRIVDVLDTIIDASENGRKIEVEDE